VADWGRRAGKSEWGGREATLQLTIPESIVWIAGPTMDLAEKEFRVVWRLTVEQGHIPVKRKSAREQWIEFENGSFVECRSEENPKQLIGEGVDLTLLVEAARMKLRTWQESIRPTLADRQGRAIFSSTPRGYNWFEEFWRRGQPENRDKFPDWRSWKFPSSVNPLITAEEIDEARRTLPRPIFEQEWLAEFTNFSGRVFDEFSTEIHVRAYPLEPHLKTHIWFDPGITNPYSTLLVQTTPEETVRVLDEVYVQGRTTDQVIAACERRWGHVMLDSAGNARRDLNVVGDEAAAEAMATWRLKGYHAVGGKPGIAQGVEVIHRMLRDPYRTVDPDETNPDGIVPRMTIAPQCHNTIREFQSYHYPDENRRGDFNSGEVPVDKDNHSISAIRYGLYVEYPELFNQRALAVDDEMLYVSTDELGEVVTRMRMDESYGSRDLDLRWRLGDY
jgi:hypothetical protein